jgi:uncharacterized protein (DUF2236 family)
VNDDGEAVRMTVQDIALVREIVRWRRNQGVEFYRWPKTIGRFSEWKRRLDGKRINVTIDEGGMNATLDYFSLGIVNGIDIPLGTVSQTVDCLVAFGFLPPRFSSAYRAGWEAAVVWKTAYQNDGPDPHGEQFRALFHDPENVSFPAVEVSW